MRNSLITLGICCMILSCTGKKGYLKYSASHPEVLAKDCLDKFPAKESFIKGKTDTLIEYSILKADSFACPEVKGQKITYIKIPTKSLKTLYISRTDTVIKRDSSALFLLMKSDNKVLNQNDEIIKLKDQKISLIIWLILAVISLIGVIYIMIIK